MDLSTEHYPRPYPHHRFMADLAEYLHKAGVTRSPTVDQTTHGDLPALFAGQMEDTPDVAVGILSVSVDFARDDANPLARFTLAHRGKPGDILGVEALAAQTFQALHNRPGLWLTATQQLLSCEQVITNPALVDQNRRWVKLDTYQCVLAVPNPTS